MDELLKTVILQMAKARGQLSLIEFKAEPVIKELSLKCEVEFQQLPGVMFETVALHNEDQAPAKTHSLYAWDEEGDGHHVVALFPQSFTGCSCSPNWFTIIELVRAFQVEKIGGAEKFRIAQEAGIDEQFDQQCEVLTTALNEQFPDVAVLNDPAAAV